MLSVFDSHKLERFDEGKLTDHQISMMLINAIKKLEAHVEKLQMQVDEVINKHD